MCKGVAWSCPIDQGPALGQRDSLGDQRSGAVRGGAGVCEAVGLALHLSLVSRWVSRDPGYWGGQARLTGPWGRFSSRSTSTGGRGA